MNYIYIEFFICYSGPTICGTMYFHYLYHFYQAATLSHNYSQANAGQIFLFSICEESEDFCNGSKAHLGLVQVNGGLSKLPACGKL